MSSNQKSVFSIWRPLRYLHRGIAEIVSPTREQDASQQPLAAPASSARPPSPGHRHSLDINQASPLAVKPTPTPEPASAHIRTPDVGAVSKTVSLPTTAPASRSTQTIPATTGAWAGLERSLRVLHSSNKLFPPVQSTISSLISCLDLMQQLSNGRSEREELASVLTTLSNLMAKHPQQSGSGQMSEAVANVVQGIEEQLKMLESWRNRGTGWKLLEADAEEEQLNKSYRRIGCLFQQLQADASLSTWSIVNDQMANTRLEGLAPAKLANYNSKLSTSISRRTCTANTRTTILFGLDDWSCDPNAAALYWMNGMAGTGKTTIACTFAELLERRKQLAASFFCTRTSPECRDATRILPTIAYQLARYSIPFQSELCKALENDPDASAKNITKQFETLLKEPLLKVKEAISDDLVVIIDALDECESIREVELLLSILLKNSVNMPMKFFVTSRPEPEIYARMKARDPGRTVLHLHEVERSLVQADIELYLIEELQSISPMPLQIQELSRRSGVLFIYAATLVRYICSRGPRSNPHRRLASVLSTKSGPAKQYSEIDTLYATILNATLDDPDLEDEEKDDIRQVLYTVLCSQEPILMGTLTELVGLADEKQTLVALEPLRPVLHFSEINGLITTLHASFPDFMFDAARSGAYFCSVAIHNARLAQRCFVVMGSRLQFNICKLESSYVPDSRAKNLPERIERAISPSLWYVCRFWADHLKQSDHSALLCGSLGNFLSNQLLFWMEVLNLKQRAQMGPEILKRGELWLTSTIDPTTSELSRHIEDARDFVTSFATNPVSQCTPHIYISSLPFCPKSSFVFRQYYQKGTGLINVMGSAMALTGARLGALEAREWRAKSGVSSLAYSPDGSRIISGSRDNAIRVWNAQDGVLVVGPLQGHTASVNSVACSPDGTRIVSGSADRTIRVWNTEDGTCVMGPLQGHTALVTSVAYSPDGTRIASGSHDHTIRLWDSEGGTLATESPKGHGWIWSVAYSPDGTRIVSAVDNTIQLWSSREGNHARTLPVAHTGIIYSVSYSPDGTRIVSGSADQTARVWNVQDGEPVTDPLQGHTYLVTSVSYSPDGTRIVSGSDDLTIRVWDAEEGTLVAGPLQGHTRSVNSVAYSPDGVHVVSGSDDDTIRVWNVQDSKVVTVPFKGGSHPNTIHLTANEEFDIGGFTDDGWVTGPNSQLLFWMPSDLRFARISPSLRCTLAIGLAGSLIFRYDDLLLGERWAQCFQT